jgi:hypothetical protein
MDYRCQKLQDVMMEKTHYGNLKIESNDSWVSVQSDTRVGITQLIKDIMDEDRLDYRPDQINLLDNFELIINLEINYACFVIKND